MDIVSALFVESFNMRQAPGPSTRIDISGAFFSRMKWSSTTFTAQIEERTSPPMPISVVAEATRRWCCAISRA